MSKKSAQQYFRILHSRLSHELEQSIQLLGVSEEEGLEVGRFLHESIESAKKDRQLKNYIAYTAIDYSEYLKTVWLSKFRDSIKDQNQDTSINDGSEDREKQSTPQTSSPKLSDLIFQAAKRRQKHIFDEIAAGTTQIEKPSHCLHLERACHKEKLKAEQKNLQEQLDKINYNIEELSKQAKKYTKTDRNSENTANEQSKSRLEFKKFMKREEEIRVQREKIIEKQNKLKEEQAKRADEEQKRMFEQNQRQKLEQRLKKEKQIHRKRNEEKVKIQKHQSQFLELKKKIFHKQNIQVEDSRSQTSRGTIDRYQKYQQEQMKKIRSQRSSLVDKLKKQKLDEHEKQYLEMQERISQQRISRLSQMRKNQKMQSEASRIKFHSSFSFELPRNQYTKKKQQKSKMLRQRTERVNSYKSRVKQHHMPQIDQKKKMDLLGLVESMEKSRSSSYRKVTMPDGKVVFEKVDERDPKNRGLDYLKGVKDLVHQMKLNKQRGRSNPDADFSEAAEIARQSQEKNKAPINYLKQMREKKGSLSTQNGFLEASRKTGFGKTQKSEMSFDEKMKKVQQIETKLMEKTKQQEMLLKFGKFKTAEQILHKKEQIDKNYLDLVNLKLQIIEQDEDL